MFCQFGSPLLNIRNWTNGFSTLAVIPKEQNYERVVNYISKYISKGNGAGYCQKRFYHTRNLNFKNKSIIFVKDDEIFLLAAQLGLECVKENDKMLVFRKKND